MAVRSKPGVLFGAAESCAKRDATAQKPTSETRRNGILVYFVTTSKGSVRLINGSAQFIGPPVSEYIDNTNDKAVTLSVTIGGVTETTTNKQIAFGPGAEVVFSVMETVPSPPDSERAPWTYSLYSESLYNGILRGSAIEFAGVRDITNQLLNPIAVQEFLVIWAAHPYWSRERLNAIPITTN